MSKVTKTKHSGAKQGAGSFWWHKKDAKAWSNKKRRVNARLSEIESYEEFLIEAEPDEEDDDE